MLPRARFGEARRRLPTLPLTDCRFSSFLSQEPAGWPWAPCGPCAAHVVSHGGGGRRREGQPLAPSALSLEAGLPRPPTLAWMLQKWNSS